MLGADEDDVTARRHARELSERRLRTTSALTLRAVAVQSPPVREVSGVARLGKRTKPSSSG